METHAGLRVARGDCAIWMPAGVEHRLRPSGRTQVRVLYLAAATCSGLPSAPEPVTVRPPLRDWLGGARRVGAV